MVRWSNLCRGQAALREAAVKVSYHLRENLACRCRVRHRPLDMEMIMTRGTMMNDKASIDFKETPNMRSWRRDLRIPVL